MAAWLSADSLLTAAANDLGYEAIFSRQIAALGSAATSRRAVDFRAQSNVLAAPSRRARAA